MIDGTYTMGVDVPFGPKDCTVVLRTEGSVVYAEIDAQIFGKTQMEGQAEGDTFIAQGSRKVKLMGKIDYTLKGEVSGDNIRIDIRTNKGPLLLEGVRV